MTTQRQDRRTRAVSALLVAVTIVGVKVEAQTLTQKVANAPDGRVQFNYASREGACGDGRTAADGSAIVRVGHFPNVTHAQGLVAHRLSRQGRGW